MIRREFEQSSEDTYICSLSSRTIVYKGMFLVGQLRQFYPDLQDHDYRTAIAVVHSRFSTNTTPSWNRAHPYRMIAHNGEINTIRGNMDRMLAREETMHSPVLEEDMDKIYPVIAATGSDSAMLDNTLEFLTMNGMDLPLAMMVLIPEPWKHNGFMSQKKKDFYHYYATMMEPWDGPAAIIFHGRRAGGRHAGPQRTPPVQILCDGRRKADPLLRGRRAGHRPGPHRKEVQAGAGQDPAGGYEAEEDHFR